MPTIYTSSANLWLQSQTLQAHDSGLLSMSREYAIPKNTALPTSLTAGNQIREAGSNYFIFPTPTITKSATDAFDRVNVTAYGKDTTKGQKNLNVSVGEYTLWHYYFLGGNLKYSTKKIECLFDVYYVKIVTDSTITVVDPDKVNPDSEDYDPGYHGDIVQNLGLPSLNIELHVRTISGSIIETVTYPDLGLPAQPLQKIVSVTNVNRTTYGSIQEVEMTCAVTSAAAYWYSQ